MPELYKDAIDSETFYRSYININLQRDILDLTQVADETSFLNFLTIAAARTSKLVIYDELAREAGISAPTAKRGCLC